LVRGGGAWVLLALTMASLSVTAGVVAAMPRSRFVWGLLAGEILAAAITPFFLRTPREPDEWLRAAMLVTPGWGRQSIAEVAWRRRTLPNGSPQYVRRLRAMEEALARLD